MLALQSTPLHLRDQDKQDRRFDQPLLFAGYPSPLHHHHQQTAAVSASSTVVASRRHHHPRHHSYHHPSSVSLAFVTPSSALTSALMPYSQSHSVRHHQHQALFYRECDLKQDLSIVNAKILNHNYNSSSSNHTSKSSHFGAPYAAAAAVCSPRIQNSPHQEDLAQLTPIQKIESRIAKMTSFRTPHSSIVPPTSFSSACIYSRLSCRVCLSYNT
ncbi:hypothetical protein BC939DRAFT_51848 [Gamsiella multidivaricata]|uniref:uncharacterized protein n=1 Tax=Gamsiella multidivaricata TaxID=101098 RepID=UPI00221E53B1|nr:uncharacterized protein BC939DRAFT_51848 [Gamsiella multidivaricata]KAI7828848.1 hypothetical protein BC939DRAFT_51848 [Gamsiella multidivaricata]